MYWLFSLIGAMLVGALLTYVLATVVGRGELLPPAKKGLLAEEHQRQLAEWPVTARNVDSVRFTTSLRGYNQQEVDEYLRRVTARLASFEMQQGDSQ
ncbi:DivIVA domain-containing protein [Corynebacterium suicordis]|uniref:DivIVA domain-containing protein n=1 Tax=Corynebacterium suicordis DSM 45110 TaxID=1121369 RepID=A0ABR9ZIM7_9CORY|nr:DivIVA domain-containing protein [Corynebacterium suicordis]MBF4553245.1 DivIVA domain-containing protein [Corynebacterium suicordis DSM 45110]MDR6277785.1 DivIVA domain-containing protein [Corynebacterium suicordis]